VKTETARLSGSHEQAFCLPKPWNESPMTGKPAQERGAFNAFNAHFFGKTIS
jgi:hypothetical protein